MISESIFDRPFVYETVGHSKGGRQEWSKPAKNFKKYCMRETGLHSQPKE
jgi:hypothetical protein